jgi:SAM-dependent methyltransferase
MLPDCPAVLELGSYSRNGSVRPLFPGAAYVGVDVEAGPGVDIVADVATLAVEPRFDVVVSTETLEHLEDPSTVVQVAHEALRPGGLLILTAAAPPRKPHRCDGHEGDLRGEHYANIEPQELRVMLRDSKFIVLDLEYNATHGDVYALARKRVA